MEENVDSLSLGNDSDLNPRMSGDDSIPGNNEIAKDISIDSVQNYDIDLMHTEKVIEVCLLTATDPISLSQLSTVFDNTISEDILKNIIDNLKSRYNDSGLELSDLGGGFRFRSKILFQPYLNKLYQVKPPRYSRAVMETLAIIAYRQPVTRGEIEDIRGVSVNSTVIQTLLDRKWIEVIGQKQIPGRPELLATTVKFLEEFNLNSLQDLPPLPHIDTAQFEPKDDLIEEYDHAKEDHKEKDSTDAANNASQIEDDASITENDKDCGNNISPENDSESI
ncbi:MAG: scpB [Burkholderiales bacterium]|jgi:segregation and condensation protein B|nr:scpB [Burkholderiales bacterium]